MTNNEQFDLLADAKVFAVAAPVILPLIERRKRDALARLMHAHKEGRTDIMTIVAELSAYTDLELELKQKQNIFRTLEEKQHGNGKRS